MTNLKKCLRLIETSGIEFHNPACLAALELARQGILDIQEVRLAADKFEGINPTPQLLEQMIVGALPDIQNVIIHLSKYKAAADPGNYWPLRWAEEARCITLLEQL